MTERDAEERLDQAIARMPDAILPSRDLWPALEARLPERAPGGARDWHAGRWAAVLAICVAGLIGWRVTLGPLAPEQPGQLATRDAIPVLEDATEPVLSPEMMLREAYEARKAEQLAALDLVDDSYGSWRQQLAIWDDAVGQVGMALDYYPAEPQLLRQLEALYQQQLDYLQQVSSGRVY